MTDLTATVSLSGVADFEYDATSGLLYLTNGTNTLYRWDPQSGLFQAPVTLANAGGSLALTPDGKYALVGHGNTIERIDLSTLSDQVLSAGSPAATGFPELVVTSSGIALVDSNNIGNLNWPVTFAAEGGSLNPTPISNDSSFSGEGQGAHMAVSENGRYVLMAAGGSFADLAIYDSTAGRITAYTGGYNVPSDRWIDINESAGLAADGLNIFDLNLNLIENLSAVVSPNQFQTVIGVHFSHDGHLLFVWNETANEIEAYRTDTWQLEAQFAAPALTNSSDILAGQMKTSADGRFLFLNTGGAVSEIDLTAELHAAIRGDATHPLLQGTAGNDVVYGGPEDDTILPGGGNDVIDGGGGTNTVSYAGESAGLTIQFDPISGNATVSGDGTSTLTNIQNVIGGAGDDTIVVDGVYARHLDGGGGNNTLSLGTYQNLFNFAAHESVSAVSSVIDLSAGTATITINLNGVLHTVTDTIANFHTVQGFGGSDLFIGTTGSDTFIGDSFYDGTVSYANATSGVTVNAGLSGPQNTGGGGTDTLTFINRLIGSPFDDHLTATSLVDGGGGNDILSAYWASYADAPAGVTVSLALQGTPQNTVSAGTDTLTNVSGLLGSPFADHLTGDANSNIIDGGGGGDDVLDGGGGINTVTFASATHGVTVRLALQGASQDTGVGHDTLSNFQNLYGSQYNDTLEGDGGDNYLKGGGGVDTVSYAHAASGVTVSLALQDQLQNTGGAGTDSLSQFQNLTGSAFNDTLEGDYTNYANVIDGGGGINTISYARAGGGGVTVSLALQGQAQVTQAGYGTDTLLNFQNLTGSANNDTLEGDGGNNVLDGGAGINTVSYAHAAAGVTVSLALQGQAQNTVGAGTDTLSNFQNLAGSAYNDILEGDGNDNVLEGGGGTNTVSYAHAASGVSVSLALQGQTQNTGGAGSDTLSNFQNLIGSAFNDTLTAGPGASTLTGGLGADTFVIAAAAGAVTITDFFDAQSDKIDLTAVAGLNNLAAVKNHAVQSGSDTIITIGSTSIDLQNVQLSSLTVSDFLFSSLYSPISVTGALAISAGHALTFSGSNGGAGAYAISGTGSLKVYGTVLVQDMQASDTLSGAITIGSAGTPIFWIQPGGSVTVSALGLGDTGYGFYAAHAASAFENDGTFSVSSTGSAYGVTLNAGGLFANFGVMTVAGQNALTVGVSETGAIVAGNTGSFSVTGQSRVDGFDLAGSGSFNNTGTITVTSSGGAAYGVLAGDSAGSLFSVINSGTITAQHAVNALASSGPMSVANKGTLNGDVVLGTAAGNAVGNIGAIHGAVIFAGTAGDQIYDGRGGTLSGGVTFASGAGVTGTDYAHLGNDGESVQGGSALLYAYGGTGADHITGGAGPAYIDGGGGNDVLDGGGSGLGTVSFFTAATGVTVSLALQGQAQNTGDGIDTLTHFTGLIGSKFDDHLTGDANNNLMDGGGGNDVLDGGGGFNTVAFTSATTGVTVSLELQERAQNTGVGTDILTNFQGVIGSSHNDVLEGGGSASTTLTGGAGADTFVYQYDRDVTITDFSAAQGDKIDLSSLLPRYMSLSDVLAAATQVNSNTIITLGSGVSAGHLTLVGVSLASLTAADFIFYTGPTVGPISGGGGSPTTGNGTMNGTSGSDWLQGGAGNDILHGGAGGDYLDGRAGVNTASYDGAYHQYTINLTSGPGLASVFGGPEGGTDDLANIQRVQFVDGYLATSPTDTAGQVYRIYEATLGRAPDQEGLTNWVNSLNSGSSLQSVVGGFVNSTEFQQVYGALDNAGFVTLLYHNVLHRDPDSGGLANWVGMLASGQDTRAQVVLGFSESNEDIAALAAPVQQGLWIADAAAGEVARLYDTVLGRLPDGSGLANWTHSLEGGMSLQSVANGFVGSQEFQTTYGSLNNTDFVTLLYHNVLHRDPDAGGLANWVGMLTSGQDTRAQVVVGFSESGEHITNTAPHVDGGIWLA